MLTFDQIPLPLTALRAAAQDSWEQDGGTWEQCQPCKFFISECGAETFTQCPLIRAAISDLGKEFS